MARSYKALPEHTHETQAVTADPPGDARLRLSEPVARPTLSAIRPRGNTHPRLSGPQAELIGQSGQLGRAIRDSATTPRFRGIVARSVRDGTLPLLRGSVHGYGVRADVALIRVRHHFTVTVAVEVRAVRTHVVKQEQVRCVVVVLVPVVIDDYGYDPCHSVDWRTLDVPAGYGGDFSPPHHPLLRGRFRLRCGYALDRGTLCALLLRCGVRFRVTLLEVRNRFGHHLLRHNPRAALGRSRARVRLAKMRAKHLAGDSERSSYILRPVRLRVCHITHLLSFTRLNTEYHRVTHTSTRHRYRYA